LVDSKSLSPEKHGPPLPEVRYDRVFDRVFAEASRREEELARERAQAPALLAQLERLPAGRRQLLIRNSRRFQGWALGQLLISQSHRLGFRNPTASLDFAVLATEVAQRVDEECFGPGLVQDLRGAAWVQLGNAQRICAELRKSEEAFGIAEHFLTRGSGDPLELARFLESKGSLRRAQRRFQESTALLEAAIALYREVDDRHREAWALISLGNVYVNAGEVGKAVDSIEAGLARVDASEDPRLVLYARHNLAVLLSDSGRHLEAQALLGQVRRLHRRFGDEMNLVRLRWLEGKVASGLGRFAEAEEALLEAQRAFVDRDLGYDAAVVSLDLAALYSRLGRTAEMKRLAAEMLPIFRAQDVHREALAALLVFRQAVEAERVTSHLIEEIRSFLDHAREDPRRRFIPRQPLPPSA
jgi:tetratricopeptide (TPR) repeat protein